MISTNGSGTSGDGILIGDFSKQTAVLGNLIGTDLTGKLELGNRGNGVEVTRGASGNTIGGLTATAGSGPGNVVSGNLGNGIDVNFATATLIQGNLVGTDSAGTAGLANGTDGIVIDRSGMNTVGGTTAAAANVVSANAADGILITDAATNNVVQGNLIGTDSTGKAALGNLGNGVEITDESASNTVGGASAPGRET